MKDVDDDDDDENSSTDEDDDKSRNDDVSDDGDRDSIPKKARRGVPPQAEIVCGYCQGEKCDCRCLLTRKRCKCVDKLEKLDSMVFSPFDRSKFIADLKKDTDSSNEYFMPNSFKSKGLFADKKVSFDVPKRR
jgi:hypothetical protein